MGEIATFCDQRKKDRKNVSSPECNTNKWRTFFVIPSLSSTRYVSHMSYLFQLWSKKTFTKLQNKFFEFRTSVERDIGAEDLRQDIFNELKMEEFEKEDDERPK